MLDMRIVRARYETGDNWELMWRWLEVRSQRDGSEMATGLLYPHPPPPRPPPTLQGFDLRDLSPGMTRIVMSVDMTRRSLGYRLDGRMNSIVDTGVRLPETVQLWVWLYFQEDTVSLSSYSPRWPEPG